MKTPQQLEQKALQDCLNHVSRTLRGDFIIEPGPATTEFDEGDLRHLYEQTLVVWRRFGEMEIIVDDREQPVGFVDPSQREGCGWVPLEEEEILELARGTGYVSEEWIILSREQGPSGSLLVVLGHREDDRSVERARLEINPRRNTVISLIPVPEEAT